MSSNSQITRDTQGPHFWAVVGSGYDTIGAAEVSIAPRFPGSTNRRGDNLVKQLCGVWVGKDIEIVRTGTFEIIFERLPSGHLQSTLSVIRVDGNRFTKDVVGKCLYDGKKVTYAARFPSEEPPLELSNSSQLAEQLGRTRYSVVMSGGELTLTSSGYNEQIKDSHLYITRGNGGATIVLDKDEDIEVLGEQTVPPRLSESTVTECLKSWQMGSYSGSCSLGDADRISPWVEINTTRHMYIFKVSESMVYCRAARYATCQMGVVFAQNFRLFTRKEEAYTQCYMAHANSLSRETIRIKPEYFDPDGCVTVSSEEGGVMGDIYWSVRSQSDDSILLNGCQGDEYRWDSLRQGRTESFVLPSEPSRTNTSGASA